MSLIHLFEINRLGRRIRQLRWIFFGFYFSFRTNSIEQSKLMSHQEFQIIVDHFFFCNEIIVKFFVSPYGVCVLRFVAA